MQPNFNNRLHGLCPQKSSNEHLQFLEATFFIFFSKFSVFFILWPQSIIAITYVEEKMKEKIISLKIQTIEEVKNYGLWQMGKIVTFL